MATINDAQHRDSDLESERDESDPVSEQDSPAKPSTVEGLRAPREQITAHISQRDKIMNQVSSALEKNPVTDLRLMFEKAGMI
jgi:hypothetical protein